MSESGRTIRHDDGSLEMYMKFSDGEVMHLTLVPEDEDERPWVEPDYVEAPLPERRQCGYGLAFEARMRAEREDG